MVVYIHSYYLESNKHSIPNAIQIFGVSLTSVAVPLFYTISGFLFYNNISKTNDCFPKVKKRIFTLFVPYIIWNVIFVAWYMVLNLLPGVSVYVNSNIFNHITITHPIDTFYFLFIKPAGFHLWFLRDLILFVLLSPVLFKVIKKFRWAAFLFFIALTGWMSRFWISYFVLGGILAICYPKAIDALRIRKRLVICCILTFLAYCILSSIGLVELRNEIVKNYFTQLFIIVPIIAIWGSYDIIVDQDFLPSKSFSSILSCTFFIYLFHEPAFNIIKKIGLKLFGINDISLISLYLINPIIMIVFSILIALFLKKKIPTFYKILVGGR